MDEARFSEAKQAYDAGDFRTSAKGFLAAAGRGADGNGAAYHMAGNSLMRLRRFADAATVYGHALRDELYFKHGSVRANLAAARVALGDYAEAVEEYRRAADDPEYATRYKALQGLAGALVEMSRFEEAAVAYRQAALDAENPDPGKALNNLGLCFMALRRPADAVEAYKAALGFESYAGRGKALANLGIAFAALGLHGEAVKAFEKASQLHSHVLSTQAVEAFELSKTAVSTAASARVKIDGWQTGETPPVTSELRPVDEGGWSTGELEALSGTAVSRPPTTAAAAAAGGVPDADSVETAFFTSTDAEMRVADKERRRAERDDRQASRSPWQMAATAVAAIVVVAGTAAAMYFSGLGFPTQTMTVNGMLSARVEGSAVDAFWVAVPEADLGKEMAKIPPIKEFQVGPVDRAARTSKVDVMITPANGAPLSYEITLSREGVGWKVSGVTNDWRATGSGP